MTFNTDQLTYNKNTNTFIVEISDLKGQHGDMKNYVIYNPKTKMSQFFRQTSVDKDIEYEIQGWWYKSKEGVKLLIIND